MAKSSPKTKIPEKCGLKLEPHQVVLRPLITEKGTHLIERHNTYTFQVHPQATKSQILSAVQELFEVRVEKVRTQIRRGKQRRYKGRIGQTSAWKKAIVTLHDDDRIQLF